MNQNKVVMAGAGVMGASLAQVYALAGYETYVYDLFEAGLEKGKHLIAINQEMMVKEGLITAEESKGALERMVFTMDKECFRDCCLVVESTVERMDIKQGFFREISEIAPKEALLATNTSGLHITEIAEACKCPERFMGQHWLNPPHLLPLCEIIAGEKPVTDLGVTAVDDKTLEVQLNVPVSYFLSLMYFPTFYPVNEAFYNTCADTFGTSPETVLSNGAFVLTDYQPAATAFAMEKNPDYYDADKIALDGLAYQVIKDSQQALMSYQTGTLDITLLNGEQVDQVKDDPEFTSVGAGYLWYISPNIDAVPDLANLNLRKAMTFALDRDAITGDVLKDGSTPAYTAVPAQFATGPDGSDFSADQTKFADDCAYDPEKAKELFETAKAELGKDTFTFDMVVDADDAPQKVAQVVKEQLETTLEGLTINLTVEPKKQRVQDMQDGTFELGLTRWGPDYADPMTYLGMWVTGNSNNYGLWSDADYDAIIDECTTGDLCTDPEGRWAALYEAEQIVLEQAVIFPLYGQCNAEMISSAVKGVEHHPCALNRVYKNTTKSE